MDVSLVRSSMDHEIPIKYIERFYIFDYGGPIVVIHIKDQGLIVYKSFSDEKLIKGMAVVANLLKRFHGEKFFMYSKYVGVFGWKFIIVCYLIDTRYSAFVLGYIKRLIRELDKIDEIFPDMVIKTIVSKFRKSFGFRKLIVI